MKINKILLTASVLFCSYVAHAQTTLTQTVKGIITDADSKKPLAGATVSLLTGSKKTALSDSAGQYRLNNIEVGRHSFVITFSGYEQRTVNEVLVSAGKQLEINVTMTEDVKKLDAVIVKGNRNRSKAINEFATASARQFSVEDTRRYPASLQDPAQMVQNFAGVSGMGDQNTIVVRGNSPVGVLWRLEGIEIPNPNHFSLLGTSGGGISMLSSSTLANSDFYTGAYPPEIGKATSGVFDLNLRTGNKDKKEHSFMFGLLGIEAASEGPFKKGGESSYLINYRYSTLGLFKLFVDFGNNIPGYQDLSYKLNFVTKKAGSFQFFGLLGANSNVDKGEKDSTLWKFDKPNIAQKINSGTGVIGLAHQYFFSKSSYIKTIVAATGTSFKGFVDTLNPRNNYSRERIWNANQQDRAYRISVLYNNKINAANTLRAGLIASHITYLFKEDNYDDAEKIWRTFFSTKGNTQYYQAYVQWKHRFSNRISLLTGMHSSLWTLNNSYSIEPRAAFTYHAARSQVITLAAGLHARPENISTYVFDGSASGGSRSTANIGLGMTKAAHVVAGYEKGFRTGWRVKAEAYFQHLYNVPVEEKQNSWFSMLNASMAYDLIDVGKLVNKGTGANYGIDLTVEKPFNKNYYVLFAGSLFRSTYKTYEGIQYNSLFNRSYQANIVTGKEWRKGRNKKNIFGINAKVLTSGGMRQSPIDLAASNEAGKVKYQQGKYFTGKTGAYFRMDLGFSYKINKKYSTHSISIDIQNVTGRKNVFSEGWDKRTQRVQKVYQLGTLPFINYRIEF